MNLIHVIPGGAKNNTNSLSKTVLSVKPLFKRFQRFEKPLYDIKDRSLKANPYHPPAPSPKERGPGGEVSAAAKKFNCVTHKLIDF